MFCRKCGTQIPEDSAFCTKCGTPVAVSSAATSQGAPMASAEYIDVFRNVVAKDHFDLFVASNRFVMLKVQSGGGGSGGILGPVGNIVELGVSKVLRRQYDDDLTLDQKLRRDKNSFAIDYLVVDSIKLGKGKLGGRIVQVRFADESGAFKKLDITVSGEQFERLGKLLASLPVLSPKVEVKSPTGQLG